MNSQQLLQRYQAGDSEAATAIFDRYVARLIALAGSRVGTKLRRRIDAEDVVQSAYRSFFVHAKRGDYELNRSGDLWRLLAKITLHKLYGQAEKQTAEKRSLNRESVADDAAFNSTAPEPTPDEAAAVVEQLQLVLKELSFNERQVIIASLQGQTVAEISDGIGKSPRTARRLLASAKRKIEQRLLSDDSELESPGAIDADAPLKYSDYVLEKLQGAGGMGKVFRAREKATGSIVAIKALHKSRQADRRAVAQFVQESQILQSCQHPNIVGVKGLGRFPGGGYFMVMDFIDGVDLRTRLRDGPLELPEVVRIMRQASAGIQYAHERGIVHCDLKPENVLLDKANRAVVTDFGFAYIIAEATPASRIGGTIGYIAPEVLSGQSPPTPAADIYSLGMLMWTLLTNNTLDQLSLNTIDKMASSIIRRCVADEREKRFLTAIDFAGALDNVQAE